MLQVTRTGHIIVDSGNLPDLREEFSQRRILRLPKFLEDSILELVLTHIEKSEFLPALSFDDRTQKELTREIAPDMDSIAVHLLTTLLNNSTLFRIIGQITDRSPIR